MQRPAAPISISHHLHQAGEQQYQHNYLTASSSSSSLTNWRGICRDSALSAICSRIRRWLPSVVGNRYVRDMTPPNTEADRNIVSQSCIQRSPVTKLSHRHRVQEDDIWLHSPAFSSGSLHRDEDLDLMPMDSVRLSSTGRTI